MNHVRTAAFTFTLAALLAGCGAAVDKVTESAADKAVEQMIESSTDENVEIDRDGDSMRIETEDGVMTVDADGNMVIESDDGTMTVENGESLPDGFPDIPMPDDLTIEATSRINDAETEVFSVSGLVDRDAKEAFDAQVAALEDAGFTIDFRNDSTADGEFYGSAMASGGDGLQVLTNFITEDGKARLQLNVTKS